MRKVNRRDLLKGLGAAAAVSSVPAIIEPLVPTGGNTLVPPHLVAREALAALKRHMKK